MIREERNALILLGVFAAAAGLLYLLILEPALSDAAIPRTTSATSRDAKDQDEDSSDLLATRPKEARRMVTFRAIVRDARNGATPPALSVVASGVNDIAEPAATMFQDGQVIVEYLPPNVLFSIDVTAPGYRSQSFPNLRADAREVVDLGLIALEPQRSVEGVVRDANGASLPGADVQLYAYRPPASRTRALTNAAALAAALNTAPIANGVTGPSGQFGFGGLPATSHLVVVSHPDHGALAHAAPAIADRDLKLDVRIPAGAPIAGDARIGRGAHPAKWPILLIADVGAIVDAAPFASIQPDATGAFSAPHLAGDAWFAFSLAPSAAAVGVGAFPRADHISVSFGEGAPVAGRVSRRTGSGYEGARISASSPHPGAILQETVSDANGAFSVDGLPYGVCTLRVEAPGFSSYERVVPVASFGAEVVVELQEPSTLEGTLLERPANPIVSDAGSPPGSPSGSPTGGSSEDPPALVGAVVSAGDQSTVTDHRGAYRLGGLAPGATTLHFRAQGFLPKATSVDIAKNKANRHDDGLQPGGSIRTQVKEPSGRPRGGALVVVIEDAADGPVPRDVGLTDGDGKRRIDGLPAGRYRMLVAARGLAPVLTAIWTLEPGTKVPGFEMTLSAPAAVEGLVLDEADAPVAGATVEAIADGQDPWAALALGLSMPTALSDADGRFRIDGLPAVKVRLTARTGDHRAGMTDAATGLRAGELSVGEWVRVAPRAPIQGAVIELLNPTSSGDGSYSNLAGEERPTAFAEVTLEGLDAAGVPIARERLASTDATGRFRFASPPYPQIRLTARRGAFSVTLDQSGAMNGTLGSPETGNGPLKIQLESP